MHFKLKSSLRFVLRELADCHNQATHQCNPSIAHISRYTGLDRKTVMNAIAQMEKMNVLAVSKKLGARTDYFLNFNLIDLSTSTKSGTGSVDESGTKFGTAENQKGDTNNGTGTKNGTSTKTTTPPVPKTGQPPVPKTGHKPISKPKTNLKDKYKGLSIADLPSEFSVETICEFIEHRINIKKPLTQKALQRFIANVTNIQSDQRIPFTANQIIEFTIDKGWAGIKTEYILNSGVTYAASQSNTGQHSTGQSSDNWLDSETLDECGELFEHPANDNEDPEGT